VVACLQGSASDGPATSLRHSQCMGGFAEAEMESSKNPELTARTLTARAKDSVYGRKHEFNSCSTIVQLEFNSKSSISQGLKQISTFAATQTEKT